MKTSLRVLTSLGALICLNACESFSRRTEMQAESLATKPLEQTPAPPSLQEELTGRPDASVTATPPTVPTIPDSMRASAPTTESPSDIQITLKKNGKEIAAPLPKNEIAHAGDDALPPGLTPQPKDLVIEPGGALPAQVSHAPLATGLTEPLTSRSEVSAEKALNWLKNGNRRFVKGYLRKDGQSLKDVRRLAQARKPHTIVLSCSDARVPPEIIFDQKLGEIEVLRTQGPTVDRAVIESLEHLVSSLGPNLLLVMGHTSCEATPAGTEDANYINSIARELEEKSDALRAAEGAGLQIKTAIYDTTSGLVSFK